MLVANFFCRKFPCYNKLNTVICTDIGLYNWTRKRSGVENVSIYFIMYNFWTVLLIYHNSIT